MNLRIIFLAALAFCLPAVAQQTKIMTADKHNEYGLVYSLPTTALQIKITAIKEVRKAAPFRQFAKKYIGDSDVQAEDAVSWTITAVDIVPFGVNDDDTQYLMQLKAGATTFIEVASDGMLLAINAESDQSNSPVASDPVANTQKVLLASPPMDEYLKYVDNDFISAQSSMKQAEMLAAAIMEVRDSKLSLTRGTADTMPVDGKQMELMLKSLEAQEDALMRAFTGTVERVQVERQFTYIPEQEGEEVLCRISDFNGIVEADDFSGAPLYIKTEVLKEGTLPTTPDGQPKTFPKDGVVYNIPGTAKITLTSGNKKLYSMETEFSQFGTTFALAPSLFTDKKNPSYAKFSSVTGALVVIGTKSALVKE